MTIPEGQEVGGRLQRALEAFQKAQGLLLTAHRRLKELSAAEVERFWAAQGSGIEKQLHATAAPRSSLPSGNPCGRSGRQCQ